MLSRFTQALPRKHQQYDDLLECLLLLVSFSKAIVSCLDIGYNLFLFTGMKGAYVVYTAHYFIDGKKRSRTLRTIWTASK